MQWNTHHVIMQLLIIIEVQTKLMVKTTLLICMIMRTSVITCRSVLVWSPELFAFFRGAGAFCVHFSSFSFLLRIHSRSPSRAICGIRTFTIILRRSRVGCPADAFVRIVLEQFSHNFRSCVRLEALDRFSGLRVLGNPSTSR